MDAPPWHGDLATAAAEPPSVGSADGYAPSSDGGGGRPDRIREHDREDGKRQPSEEASGLEQEEDEEEYARVDLDTSADEGKCITEFCLELVNLRGQIAALRAERDALKAERKDLAQQLFEYMDSRSLTCIPVEADGKALYMRTIAKRSSRPISDAAVQDAIFGINREQVVRAAETLAKRADGRGVPSLMDVLVETVDGATRQMCAYESRSLTITASRERGTQVGRRRRSRPKAGNASSASAGRASKRRRRAGAGGEKEGPPEGRTAPGGEEQNEDDEDGADADVHRLPDEVCAIAYRLYRADKRLAELAANGRELSRETTALTSDLPQRACPDTPGPDPSSSSALPGTPSTPSTPASEGVPATAEGEAKPASKRVAERARQEELHNRHADRRDVISGYLHHFNPKKLAVQVTLRVEGRDDVTPFFLREKRYSSGRQFPTREYRPTVRTVASDIFRSWGMPEDTPYCPERVADVLADNVLTGLVSRISAAIAAYRRTNRETRRVITLDRVPVRRRGTSAARNGERSSDRRAFSVNRLDSADATPLPSPVVPMGAGAVAYEEDFGADYGDGDGEYGDDFYGDGGDA